MMDARSQILADLRRVRRVFLRDKLLSVGFILGVVTVMYIVRARQSGDLLQHSGLMAALAGSAILPYIWRSTYAVVVVTVTAALSTGYLASLSTEPFSLADAIHCSPIIAAMGLAFAIGNAFLLLPYIRGGGLLRSMPALVSSIGSLLFITVFCTKLNLSHAIGHLVTAGAVATGCVVAFDRLRGSTILR